MRAIVLVGGFGTRLQPLTLATPKQMLPVVGRPMIERVLGWLHGHGVTDAVLSLGYRPDAFLDAYPDGRCAGVDLHYAVEDEPLDTAGAVRFAARSAGIDEAFIVVNGDVLTDLDVTELWAFHHGHHAEGTIALTPVEDPSRFGVVPIDADGRVEAFVEKPAPGTAPTNWINAGTYVLDASVLDRIPGDRPVSIERETFPAMVADGSLFALRSDAYWLDAGTPATYLAAQLDLVDGHRGPTEPAIHPSATVATDAVIDHSVLMAGVVVGAGAKVRDSVLLPGARVEADTIIDSSVIGAEAVIGSRCRLTDHTVVGGAHRVAEGTSASGERLPDLRSGDPTDTGGK